MKDYILKNGKVFNSEKKYFEKKDIFVKDGKIVRMDMDIQQSDVLSIDLEDAIVAPGLIDMHTHIYPLCGMTEDTLPKVGFALITLRNGNQNNPKYKKVYAEKLLMLKEGQHSPMHFHWNKSEDIINRGGGTLIIHVYNDDGNEQLDGTEVSVNSDGRTYLVPAGAGVELKPGESITLWPHQFHDFDVKPGTGDVLIGEVSMCNDDNTDNCFNPPVGRFPEIEEDEEPYRLLCNEYPEAM